jgi:hypothetical protein
MRIDQVILSEKTALRQVVAALKNRLTLTDNMQCKIIQITTAVALTPFIVDHNLGKVPIAYFYNMDVHGSVRDVNRGAWTITQMQLECSASPAVLILVVF